MTVFGAHHTGERPRGPVGRAVAIAVLALAGTAAVAAMVGAASRPAAAAHSDQAVVDRWRTRADVHAVSVVIGDGGHPPRTITSGHDAGAPVTPRTPFRVGSVTKTFVATVILQLADEGRLRLDDPLSRHLPASPWGDVTLRQLLNHTGGVPDHNQADGLAALLIERPERRWSTTDVLGLVTDRSRDFAPGTDYRYSNTGYVLLGEVIAAVTGRPWPQALRHRIIDPIGLRDTFVAGEEPVTGNLVSGWFDTTGDGFDDRLDAPWPALETSEGPAGALVSTAPDLARFARALFAGALISPEARRAMTASGAFHPPRSGYGLGVELLRPDQRDVVWGHGGALPGHRATMWYAPARDRVIIVLANRYRCDTADLADLLLVRPLDRRGAAS